jgi:hypothetical protein
MLMNKHLKQCFQVSSHVIASHIPRSIVQAFSTTKLLALAKPFGSIQLIAMHELSLLLVNEQSFIFKLLAQPSCWL